MGSFDQIVLASLKSGSSKSFKEILARRGLSHDISKRYLQHFMDQGLVLRPEKVKNRCGRPEYGYYSNPRPRQRVNLTPTTRGEQNHQS